jgi:hypothetical protein
VQRAPEGVLPVYLHLVTNLSLFFLPLPLPLGTTIPLITSRDQLVRSHVSDVAEWLSSMPMMGLHPHCLLHIYIYFFFSGGTVVSTQGFKLARQAVFYLSHSLSPILVLDIFQNTVSGLFAWGWLQTAISLISAS